ncbi:MAG: LacI family DNA-binding transcriptional regulator [Candidatus Izimaplasma sp.]|nr:LacI family DNA-binding transcriptional regulator [Candidatus Izimaplasma bacterium]
MATIKEIAERADCSISTVSRVLNFDESLRVSDEKKELILKIAEELQYKTIKQRNAKKRYKVGVVSMYSTLEELEDPFYLSIRLGVEKAVEDKAVDLVFLHDTNDGYDFKKLRGVDGIVAIGHFSKKDIKAMLKYNQHIVFVNSKPNPHKYDSILFDGDYAVKQVINYLYRHNHRKIGYIGVEETRASKDIDLDETRYELVKKYLSDKSIYDKTLIYHGNGTHSDGYQIMKQIIDQDQMPSAFFFGNDSMCIGALTALYEAGIRVPDHVSLVGYNDITNAEFTLPPLTTVKVYTELMGEKGLELLFGQLAGRTIPLKIITPTKLIKRKSVTALKN